MSHYDDTMLTKKIEEWIKEWRTAIAIHATFVALPFYLAQKINGMKNEND